MRLVFCVIGPSSSGKDTIFSRLVKLLKDRLVTLVTYTTRPMREGEKNGNEYFFTNDEHYEFLKKSGRIIEERTYETVMGKWHYFTVDDNQFRELPEDKNIIVVTAPEQCKSYCDYFGRENIVPIYIDVKDATLLRRAISREERNPIPNFEEVCRRFIADKIDFSQEVIDQIGIDKKFNNNGELEDVLKEIIEYMEGYLCASEEESVVS